MNAELQIIMPLDALLDADYYTAAELEGYGPVPADIARDIMATSKAAVVAPFVCRAHGWTAGRR